MVGGRGRGEGEAEEGDALLYFSCSAFVVEENAMLQKSDVRGAKKLGWAQEKFDAVVANNQAEREILLSSLLHDRLPCHTVASPAPTGRDALGVPEGSTDIHSRRHLSALPKISLRDVATVDGS